MKKKIRINTHSYLFKTYIRNWLLHWLKKKKEGKRCSEWKEQKNKKVKKKGKEIQLKLARRVSLEHQEQGEKWVRVARQFHGRLETGTGSRAPTPRGDSRGRDERISGGGRSCCWKTRIVSSTGSVVGAPFLSPSFVARRRRRASDPRRGRGLAATWHFGPPHAREILRVLTAGSGYVLRLNFAEEVHSFVVAAVLLLISSRTRTRADIYPVVNYGRSSARVSFV